MTCTYDLITYHIVEHQRLSGAFAYAQAHKNLCCLLAQWMAMEEDTGKNLDLFLQCIHQLWLLFCAALCGPETPKCVLWQTVRTQMKCCIVQHFIWRLHCLLRQNPSS